MPPVDVRDALYVSVDPDQEPATVTNTGNFAVYYQDAAKGGTITSVINDGSIAASASQAFVTSTYLLGSAAGCQIEVVASRSAQPGMAKLGNDGTVGGSGGSPLSSSVVSAISATAPPTTSGGTVLAPLANGNAGSLLITAEKVFLGDATLSGTPADNSGVSWSDAQVAAAVAKALTYRGNGPGVISAVGGIYKLGQHYQSLVLPGGVSFAECGGGGKGSVTLSFPNASALPTAIGQVSSATSTTLAVNNINQTLGIGVNSFPAATPSTPQTVMVYHSVPVTYTGITGSGSSVTLTGCTYPAAITPSTLVGGEVVGGPLILASNTANQAWVIDHTVNVQGPGGGSRSLWCPASTLNGSVNLASLSTITLTSTSGFPTGGCIMLASTTGMVAVTYTGVSGNNLTGCALVNSSATGTVASGTSVFYITPPTAVDGVFVGSNARINCQVSGVRHATVHCGDHERWGKDFNGAGCYSMVATLAPRVASYVAFDSGDQYFEAGIDWHGALMATHYIDAFNHLVNPLWYGGATSSGSPWVFWKEPVAGVTGADGGIVVGGKMYDQAFEAPGLGIVGSPDGVSTFAMDFDNCEIGWDGNKATAPGNLPPIAEFVAGSVTMNVKGGNMFSAGGPEGYAVPYWMADLVSGYVDSVPYVFLANRATIGYATGQALAGFAPYRFGFLNAGECAAVVVNGRNGQPTIGELVGDFGTDDTNFPGLPICGTDTGANAILGVAIAAFSGHSGRTTGPVAVSEAYGPVLAKVHTNGDITANSLVCSNGVVSNGSAKSISAAAGALAAGSGAPPKITEGRNYSVGGLIAVPSGATNFLPPFFEPVDSGVTKKLVGVRYAIRAGTSATFAVTQNGSNVSSCSALVAATTPALTAPGTPPSVADGDEFAIVVGAISGTPDGLSVTLIFETTPVTTTNGQVFGWALAADSGGFASVLVGAAP